MESRSRDKMEKFANNLLTFFDILLYDEEYKFYNGDLRVNL